MGYAHASLVIKDLTVAAARKDIARQLTRHVKVQLIDVIFISYYSTIIILLLLNRLASYNQ